MIKNQAQLAKAKADVELLSATIKDASTSDNIEEMLQLDIWESRLSELTEEVEEYKSWENGKDLQFTLKDLSKAVIAMRVASKMTQKDLALKLGVKEQQIQRYEKQEYLTASFERVIQLFRLLCTNVVVKVSPKRTIPQTLNRFALDPRIIKAKAKMKQNGAPMLCRTHLECVI